VLLEAATRVAGEVAWMPSLAMIMRIRSSQDEVGSQVADVPGAAGQFGGRSGETPEVIPRA